MAKSLAFHKSLKKLHFICDTTVEPLIEHLGKISTLLFLEIISPNFTGFATQFLCEYLITNNSLKELKISNYTFYKNETKLLFDSLKNNTKLSKLSIETDVADITCFDHVQECFEKNIGLKNLDIGSLSDYYAEEIDFLTYQNLGMSVFPTLLQFVELADKKVFQWPTFHSLLDSEGKVRTSKNNLFAEKTLVENIVTCSSSLPMEVLAQIIQIFLLLFFKKPLPMLQESPDDFSDNDDDSF